VDDRKLDALAIQCWTSIQANLGICSCTTMSRFDDRGIPCACESDIMGALSMHALQLASAGPSCLADWNNLHNDDSELVNCWHCGVFPVSWAKGKPKMGCQEIIAGTTGRDNAMGVVEFVMKDGPVTLCRATQDNAGQFKVVLAQGTVEPNKARTFGSYGWVRIPGIGRLYKNVLLRHFPHHVAMNRSTVGNVLWEAFGNYLGFQVFTADCTRGLWTPDMPFKV
jgi:L-fucose isomerase-like protein